jgi:23S rRNA pseudouridine2605 synthase
MRAPKKKSLSQKPLKDSKAKPSYSKSDKSTSKFNTRHNQNRKPPGDPLPKMDAVDQRLNKFLSNAGVCSRREADVLIGTGVISVNGKIVTELGHKIKPGDTVQYDGQTVSTDKKRYILINKPKEYVTSVDDTWNRKSIYDLLRKKVKETVYPVGQLDRSTTGLMLYTNDGDLFKKLVHPAKMAVSMFHVTLQKPFNVEHLLDLNNGKWDMGKRAKVLNAQMVDNSRNFELGIEIKTDNGNSVKRIFENHGYQVEKLDRVTFAGLTKKDLGRGFFRDVTEKELNFLRMY